MRERELFCNNIIMNPDIYFPSGCDSNLCLARTDYVKQLVVDDMPFKLTGHV